MLSKTIGVIMKFRLDYLKPNTKPNLNKAIKTITNKVGTAYIFEDFGYIDLTHRNLFLYLTTKISHFILLL